MDIDAQLLVLEIEFEQDVQVLELEPASLEVAIVGNCSILELQSQQEVIVLDTAKQGPAGPPGPPGSAGASVLTVEAGENISALRAVRVFDGKAFYVNSSTASDASLVTGISITGASAGADVLVQVGGEVIDNSWSWTEGTIYVGTAGGLTQTLPTTGFICGIARALAPSRLLVDVQYSILRG